MSFGSKIWWFNPKQSNLAKIGTSNWSMIRAPKHIWPQPRATRILMITNLFLAFTMVNLWQLTKTTSIWTWACTKSWRQRHIKLERKDKMHRMRKRALIKQCLPKRCTKTRNHQRSIRILEDVILPIQTESWQLVLDLDLRREPKSSNMCTEARLTTITTSSPRGQTWCLRMPMKSTNNAVISTWATNSNTDWTTREEPLLANSQKIPSRWRTASRSLRSATIREKNSRKKSNDRILRSSLQSNWRIPKLSISGLMVARVSTT